MYEGRDERKEVKHERDERVRGGKGKKDRSKKEGGGGEGKYEEGGKEGYIEAREGYVYGEKERERERER
jgi:hypothetical protein